MYVLDASGNLIGLVWMKLIRLDCVKNEVLDKVYLEVSRKVLDKVQDKVSSKVWEKVHRNVLDKVYDQLIENLK